MEVIQKQWLQCLGKQLCVKDRGASSAASIAGTR
jgi:hypothetical protein